MRILGARYTEEAFAANREREVFNYFYIHPLLRRKELLDSEVELV